MGDDVLGVRRDVLIKLNVVPRHSLFGVTFRRGSERERGQRSDDVLLLSFKVHVEGVDMGRKWIHGRRRG
jgi:hypothetical protein